ncbi:MAG: PQQ-binding-like beta-propeller repeat protein [Acidobacteria bacterium]|nr:PQQ-binding-like beta-propeller repeat protein [Acidobacteriota bacterium]
MTRPRRSVIALAFALVLSGSAWGPPGTPQEHPERTTNITRADSLPALPEASDSSGSWSSFRGTNASGVADGMDLPATWDGESGANVLWRVGVPGLAHSSPVVWGNRVFVTSAISSEETASFRPGLYGEGTSSEDLSEHRWVVHAFDKNTGETLWEQVAYEGVPREQRHIKSTYASSTPATDGRVVVAWFGSQGVYAYTIDGDFMWSLDLGHVSVGSPRGHVEWGPASSPYIWEGKVFLQVDTQTDDFLLALDSETGEALWKADREELPSWGTPTVVPARTGPELVTNGANFIRGYEPNTGEELWRLGGSSMITAPTPIYTDDHIVVASGRAPERPIFVLRHGARGDLTLPVGTESSESVVWSRQQRGPYMPTPLIYRGVLYVLANGGAFAAYDLETGAEFYRERIPHAGSGFSASPVASDGKVYLWNEDGDIFVMKAGREFEHLGTNSMGELLMATPALSEGVMYVRSVDSLFAIGRSE